MKLFIKRLFCKHIYVDSNTVGWEVCCKCLKLKENE